MPPLLTLPSLTTSYLSRCPPVSSSPLFIPPLLLLPSLPASSANRQVRASVYLYGRRLYR